MLNLIVAVVIDVFAEARERDMVNLAEELGLGSPTEPQERGYIGGYIGGFLGGYIGGYIDGSRVQGGGYCQGK